MREGEVRALGDGAQGCIDVMRDRGSGCVRADQRRTRRIRVRLERLALHVLFTRSTDGGSSWSAQVRVNDGPLNLNVDHFFPALSVDRDGKLYSLFYDRRTDPRNFRIDAYLATSEDGGLTWKNDRLTPKSMPPLTATPVDLLSRKQFFSNGVSLPVDASGRGNGVIAAWADSSLGNLNIATARTDQDDDRVASRSGKDH
jgi:hypothetical protein